MPLHDWRDERGWEGVHLIWLTQLLDWVQPRLPGGYRVYLGSVPALTVDTPNGRPDVSVRKWTEARDESAVPDPSSPAHADPYQEAVATFTLDPQRAVQVERRGRLIATIEVISTRNKDRPAAREPYLGRYAGYLRQGVHLLLIDVLPRPAGFSFADALAANLGLEQPACPPPFAISYRVGGPVPDGTVVGFRWRLLQVGQPLPVLPLALEDRQTIPIDLEHTYREAARRAYLD